MLHNYAARIYLMMYDHGLTFAQAFDWVCRHQQRNFKSYYQRALMAIFLTELCVHV